MGARHNFRQLLVDHKLSFGQPRDAYIREVGERLYFCPRFPRSLFAMEGRRPAETETRKSAQGQKQCGLDVDSITDRR